MSKEEIQQKNAIQSTTSSEESACSTFSDESSAVFGIKIHLLASEANDFIINKPGDLDAVVIHRRRKTTTEEFSQTLSSLRSETRKLNFANTNAEKLSGLAKAATDGFQGAIRLFINYFLDNYCS